MADNLSVKDAAGSTIVLKSTDNSSVQLPAHQVRDSTGANALAVSSAGAAKVEGAGTAGTAAGGVVSVQGVASMTPLGVSVASGGVASGAIASGAIASGAVASGAVASGAFASGAIASGAIAAGAIAAGAIAAGATSIAENEDVASADGDRGVKILAIQRATPADTAGTDLDYSMLQMSAGRLWVDASGKTLTVASHAVTVASGGIASGAVASGAIASGAFASGAIGSGAVASGAVASGAFASGAIGSGAIASGAIASGAIAAGAIATGATSIAANEDDASANLDTGVKILAIQKATPADTAGTDGDYAMPQMSAGRLWVAAILPSGSVASGAVASGAVASGAFASGSIASGAIAAGAVAAGATSIADNEDVASADGDRGIKVLFKRTDTPANSSGTDGDYEQPQMSAGRLWVSASIPSGGVASGAVASGAFASGSIASGAIASGAIAVGAIAAGATSIADNEDVASADGDRGVKILAVRKATPVNTSGTDGDYEFPQISGGYLWTHDNKGLSNLAFAAAFTTLTRPANTTAYTALDSISDNATAGSVTALSATLSDVNDDPIFISDILVNSTDTGLAGKRIRAYLFNADPTASTGVGGGDNAAFSQKKNGYIGSFSGVLESGFSDGTIGRLVPTYADGAAASTPHAPAGGFLVTKPTSGAKTLYIQYQAVDGFTPSANSTTIIGTARGWQARAV